MKHLMLVSLVMMVTGCKLDLEEVQTRESACKTESGQIKRVMQNSVVTSIRCVVDGVEYWVAPSGRLK